MRAYNHKKEVAEYEAMKSLDSLEGVVSLREKAAPSSLERLPGGELLFAVYPGVLAALTIALASTWLSQHYGAPVMLFGLLFGMAFNFLHEDGRCVAGIEFASRSILRTGVALLGVRITVSQMISLGPVPVLTVIVGVVSTILLGTFVAKRMGLDRIYGILSGGAVAVCGASAALAIASVLPQRPESERDTILTVVVVTGLSTLAMIFYPVLVGLLHLSGSHAGVFLGGTIHDVAQVIGAGYMISPETGDIATYVKLLRVAMLLPVVTVISWLSSRNNEAQGKRSTPLVPVFLLGFAALVAINSFGVLPPMAIDAATEISRWCLVTAIAALGMKTSFKRLLGVGWRPVGLMVVETAWIAGLVLASVEFLM